MAENHPTSIRLTRELKNYLTQIARAKGWNRAQLIVWVLTKWAELEQKKER